MEQERLDYMLDVWKFRALQCYSGSQLSLPVVSVLLVLRLLASTSIEQLFLLVDT